MVPQAPEKSETSDILNSSDTFMCYKLMIFLIYEKVPKCVSEGWHKVTQLVSLDFNIKKKKKICNRLTLLPSSYLTSLLFFRKLSEEW